MASIFPSKETVLTILTCQLNHEPLSGEDLQAKNNTGLPLE